MAAPSPDSIQNKGLMPDFAPLTEPELLAIQGPQVALRGFSHHRGPAAALSAWAVGRPRKAATPTGEPENTIGKTADVTGIDAEIQQIF
jgi:hypothetical protein